jgi:hypothetical protein
MMKYRMVSNYIPCYPPPQQLLQEQALQELQFGDFFNARTPPECLSAIHDAKQIEEAVTGSQTQAVT